MERLKGLIRKLNEMGIFDELECDEESSVTEECMCPECAEVYDEEFFGLVEINNIEKIQSLELRLLLQDIQVEIDKK